MLCAICHRPGRGFLWQDPQAPREGRAAGRRERVRFCSVRCQTLFGTLHHHAATRARRSDDAEAQVIDASDTEKAAMASALRPLGDYVVAVGVERPLAAYSRDEILALIERVIDAYQAHLLEAAEREAARQDELYRRLEERRNARLTAGEPF